MRLEFTDNNGIWFMFPGIFIEIENNQLIAIALAWLNWQICLSYEN